ncbi:MAG: 1-acyl-sn-glycerol-3-phosphate acyltransferase, partial [Sulfitobacter sp.]|nr:1-acyl-sn-glycerol-3-phosphate acyltransferase [Sulfitobacter sp.]
KMPYKVGTAVLYEQLGQPCVPVATNAGVFWPRRGLFRRPGVVVVEYLEPVQPGADRATFLAQIEKQIEEASDRLLEETGVAHLYGQD